MLIISEDLLKVFSKLFLFAILCFKQWSVKENCVEKILHAICRSSHRRWSVRKGVLRNFAKFTGKHLCQSLFFNKVEGLRPGTLLIKRLWHKCFPVNFGKFLRTPFYRTSLDDCFCIWDTFLYGTSCNFNSHRFRYKLIFIPFLFFCTEQKWKPIF